MAHLFLNALSVLAGFVRFSPFPLFHFVAYSWDVSGVGSAAAPHPGDPQVEPPLDVGVHGHALVAVDQSTKSCFWLKIK